MTQEQAQALLDAFRAVLGHRVTAAHFYPTTHEGRIKIVVCMRPLNSKSVEEPPPIILSADD
jgi:hypothetical protein